MPKVSILISVRDQLALTQKCLSKLEATLDESISFEVLIANDGSVDGTREFLGQAWRTIPDFSSLAQCWVWKKSQLVG